jgi:hypothetical protein
MWSSSAFLVVEVMPSASGPRDFPKNRALLLFPSVDFVITKSCGRGFMWPADLWHPELSEISGVCSGAARCGARMSRVAPCTIAQQRHRRP